MAETLTLRVTLRAETCFKCGFTYGLPHEFLRRKWERGGNWWCPSCGQDTIYSRTELQKLRDQVREERAWKERAQVRLAEERADRERAERSASAYKGVATKLRKRAAAGVCPCCNRTFKQLARHMERQHPEYVAEHGHAPAEGGSDS